MKLNDKVIAAFFVSLGVFSASQAAQYVGTLSLAEKKSLVAVVQLGATDSTEVAESRPVSTYPEN